MPYHHDAQTTLQPSSGRLLTPNRLTETKSEGEGPNFLQHFGGDTPRADVLTIEHSPPSPTQELYEHVSSSMHGLTADKDEDEDMNKDIEYVDTSVSSDFRPLTPVNLLQSQRSFSSTQLMNHEEETESVSDTVLSLPLYEEISVTGDEGKLATN